MSFTHPYLLLLLSLPVALVAWEWLGRGHRVAVPFDHGPQKQGMWWNRLIKTANLLPALLLTVAVLIVSGPKKLAPPREERLLTNIQFCLDVSGSMVAPFGDRKRSDAAIQSIQDFVTYRKGDAFGLTIFGSDVLHWVPITKDLSALKNSTPFLRPERMPPYMGGTMIGKALRSIHKNLKARPEGDRMIVLVSDGESADLRGDATNEIAQELAADHIVVYYIHVADGAPQAETFSLTQATGGQAFAAGDPVALKEVFRKIDEMQSSKMKQGTPEWVDFYRPFTGAGLVLLGLQTLAFFGLRFTPW